MPSPVTPLDTLLRRLFAYGASTWRFVSRREGFFSRGAGPRNHRQRPLRVLRLERRRVLSADFSLAAGGLWLDGFDSAGGDTLNVSQQDDAYLFTVGEGEAWRGADGGTPEGVSVDGETLTVDASLLRSLESGLTVTAGADASLDVSFGSADFSGLAGPVSFLGASSIGQQPGSLLTAPDSQPIQFATSPVGMTVGNLSLAGDLSLLAFGPITDAPGTQIFVSGNATFTSLGSRLEADFDTNGVVDSVDYDAWAAGYGLASGAESTDGDANGDGAVDAADYTVWRDTLGQVGTGGGITLADNPGDRLTIGGVATFDASQEGGRFAIDIGAGGRTEFGTLRAYGGEVDIVEDSPTLIDRVDADRFNLTTAGEISTTTGAEILVSGDAQLLSTETTLFADFNADRVVDTLDYDIWAAGFGAGSTFAEGDANRDGAVDIADYNLWRDESNRTIEPGGIAIVTADTFSVGGHASLTAADGADRFDIVVAMPVGANFGSLSLVGDAVDVQEDSGTRLTGVSARTLTLASDGSITDAPGTALTVDGLARFTAAGDITLGDDAGDTTNFGSLALLGGAISVQEDSATELTEVDAASLALTSAGSITDADATRIVVTGAATFDAGAGDITLGDHPGDTTTFGSLGLTGGVVSVQEDDGTELTGVDAVQLTLSSDGPITDAPGTAVSVLLHATLDAGPDDITLGDEAADTTHFGSLNVTGGAVTVQEDSGTVLTGVDAATLSLTSDGPITDAPGTTIGVNDLARFDAGAFDITLGDDPGDTTNFGSLSLVGGAVAVTEDSGTLLVTVNAGSLVIDSAGDLTDAAGAAIDVASDALFTAAGAVLLGDNAGDTLTVGGKASFAGATITVGPAGVFNTGQLNFNAPGAVFIQEDSSTEVAMDNTAGSLTLESAGNITDADATGIDVDGAAMLTAAGLINLNDAAGDTLGVGGKASFAAGTAISVGSAGVFNAGQINFNAPGVVFIQEDSATHIAMDNTAGSLSIYSTGGITDAENTSIVVTPSVPLATDGDARFVTMGSITLADTPGDILSVLQGKASFTTASTITIGPAGAFNAEQINFNASGSVFIQEDSATEVAMTNTSGPLELRSAGAITDAEDTSIFVSPGIPLAVDVDAIFVAAGSITLADTSGDVLSVQIGKASFAGATITVGPAGLFNAEQINFNAPGAVSIQEDSATEIAMDNTAGSLTLDSDGAITDAPATSIDVTGAAVLTADGDITLGDDAGDTTDFGTIALDGGAVSVQEDSQTDIAGVTAASLVIASDGAIFDEPTAVIDVTGDAAFDAGAEIVLANGGAANALTVGGHASFAAAGGSLIDVGVLASGAPAPATATAGSIQFNTTGDVRVALDSDVVLDSESTAQTARLRAEGSITDNPLADTTITQDAELVATGDVVLGDGAAFAMATDGDDPTPFDASRYLAIAAMNVSVEADSAVNFRTAASDPAFVGSFFLTAKGTIAQLINAADDASRLTADRVALESTEGAVLFSRVELTSPVTADDTTTPNLAVHAGGVESFLATVAPRVSEFNVGLIPSDTITAVSPITVSAPSSTPDRGDGSGLVNQVDSRITEPGAIGDDYAIVVGVHGDAKIGAVTDATGAQATLVGVATTGTTGNAYVESTALANDGEGSNGDGDGDFAAIQFAVAGVGESGDLVFSRYTASSDTVVSMAGGVFTAVAAGALIIDTESPDELLPATARTTKLTSATGTVTSVATHTTYDSELTDAAGAVTTTDNIGPRMILDPPSEAADAATTGLVLAATDFEQRVTLAIGSRGEDNLVLEFEWADVVNNREPARPDLVGSERDRQVLDPETPGADPYPGVADAPESIETVPFDADLVLSTPIETRVVTIRHQYDEAFVPANPVRGALPTTIRVFNDPAINLFQAGGEEGLNANSNTVTPRIITLPPPGYFEPIPADTPATYPEPEVGQVRTDPSQAPQVTAADNTRSSAVSGVEVILYGRIDDRSNDWADDIPGEEWPRQWDQETDGDFLQAIREEIDEGPASEGRYRVVTETPRGDQQLEEWVKGDRVDELMGDAFTAPIDREAPAPNAVQDPDADDTLIEPLPEPFGRIDPAGHETETSPEASPGSVTAAAVAVAAWRRRTEPRGELRQDEDGVAFTRVERRRRRF